MIDRLVISLSDQPKPETIESDTEKRLQNIFLLYEDATKKLECRDFEILQLNRKIQTFINDGMCTIIKCIFLYPLSFLEPKAHW